jgi:hypothetical protein
VHHNANSILEEGRRMARKHKHGPKHAPAPQAGAGAQSRRDDVDATKGIFPYGSAHAADAKVMMPGELGGGPYEESGRSALDVTMNPAGIGAAEQLVEGASAPLPNEEELRPSQLDRLEAKGGRLPAHRASHP